jgi:LacI family transcriptional regulator
VSLVVRDSTLVAPGTKERVQAAIAQLGYRPHAAAAALRSARSLTLGYLVPWGYEPHMDAPRHPPDVYPNLDIFRNQLINAMTVKARGAGYYLLLDIFDEVQRGLELFKSARIDGMLVDMLISDTVLDELIARQIPLVLVGRDGGERGISWVKTDEAGGVYVAMHHLLALGHRRCGIITASDERTHPLVHERMNGYRRALAEANLPVESQLVAHGDWSFQSGYVLGLELLRLQRRPTALFVLSEVMAAGTLQAADELGLRIPGDVAIVTTEDSPWVDYLQPPLTAVHVPMYEVGARATDILLSLLENPLSTPQQVVLPTKLVVRRSTMPLSS